MKLLSIHIQNFESHKDTKIDFSKNVNAIIGNTGTGKSGILRAIEWVLYPRNILGDDFRSDFGGDTSVKLWFENRVIERRRTSSFNGYILNEDEKNPFKGFASKIPEEILSFINMSEVNFESQFDSHYMITWSPGQVGHYLNKITDLEASDRVISHINSKTRFVKKEIDKHTENVKENIEEKRKLSKNIDEIEESILKAESIDLSITKIESEIKDISSNIETLKSIEKKKREYDVLLGLKSKTVELETIHKKIEKENDEIKKLESFILHYKDIIEEKNDIERDLEISKEELQKIMPEECPLCGGEIWKLML